MKNSHLQEVAVSPLALDRLAEAIGTERFRAFLGLVERLRQRLRGRTVWHVNSTARGGGVAEMLRSHLAYVRGAEVDTRWLVINGSPEFFHLTKRLHHALHGSPGDGSPLGPEQHALYEKQLAPNATELEVLVRRGDVVVLHDPQTAGLAHRVEELGATPIWRCHVGTERSNAECERAWRFLGPYLEEARALIFSRKAFVPPSLDSARTVVIPPSIDPFSPKNQALSPEVVRSILVRVGIVEGPAGAEPPVFRGQDGSPRRVDRGADVQRLGPEPSWDSPMVVQVSRWDPLKDPVGVLRGFERLLTLGAPPDTHLVLAGPNVRAVSDDPEGGATYDQVEAAWRALPHAARRRVSLASLPMVDVDENAAIVNALQRHAAVVVQKSLQEGFGLTVAEAMWKGRPVLASAVGGIQDQIEDGVHGVLLHDPSDLDAFARALNRLLAGDRAEAERMGERARARVEESFLGVASFLAYGRLLEDLDV